MFYNLLNFPLESNVPNRIQHLDVILNNYQPDIFAVCELNNESGANAILQVLQDKVSEQFRMPTFSLNTSDDEIGNQNDLQNLIFYNSSKFILESQDIVQTIYRDFNHYKLKLNSINQDSNPLYLDVIVCHLKASNGVNNQALRLEMVQDLTTYLNTFPANSQILLAGDFNVYTHTEAAFQELLDVTNHIVLADPANRTGSWHNNTNYIDMFTQSTRTQTGLGGSTGGFDDRFDLILTSSNMLSNSNISYVTNSYQAYGNNGNINCYNNEIKDEACAGADFSYNIREALYYFSDHLPVTLQLKTNETLLNIQPNTQESLQIIGTNMIESILEIKINNPSYHTKKLNIFNTLGQEVKSVPVGSSNKISMDVSTLSKGIYYLTLPNTNVQPLKFVKTN
ncbi:hypothetical protein DI383_12975 [Flavobacteriaceae bacterium LYZ1037]|nr:hypothetical protein DI383_12975 [Flavobacteriaceae bacterium LYZ1037]